MANWKVTYDKGGSAGINSATRVNLETAQSLNVVDTSGVYQGVVGFGLPNDATKQVCITPGYGTQAEALEALWLVLAS